VLFRISVIAIRITRGMLVCLMLLLTPKERAMAFR
jgi:hypothetical protein